MKFSLLLLSLFSLARLSCGEQTTTVRMTPYRLSFPDLVEENNSNHHALLDHQALYDALSSLGMISITNIPDSFMQDQIDTLTSLHDCAVEETITSIQEHMFEDGTRRRTLATRSTKAYGTQPLLPSSARAASCESLEEASRHFRHAVAVVTQAFAHQLDQLLIVMPPSSSSNPQDPLLTTLEGDSFDTMAQVVEEGEHLEHFHSYQNEHKKYGTNSTSATIDWHTDQGLFLVFTPARWSSNMDGRVSRLVEDETGFFVQLRDGTSAMVQFEDGIDQLVILLGDGIHQVLQDRSGQLRATPHALSMPVPPSADVARMWYGRMVLPPVDAIHPAHPDMTFGDVRRHLIEINTKSLQGGDSKESHREVITLGCSAPNAYARQLDDSSCAGDTLLCWHTCMNETLYNVSQTICQQQGLDLACISPRRQLWTGLHGDYFPACIDKATAQNYTTVPPLPARNAVACTSDHFAAFLQASSGLYDHQTTLQDGVAELQWSMDSDNKQVKGKLIYNGLFGWLAFGFANVGGPSNGMHGAHIIMALPGGNYSVWTGLDLSLPRNIQGYVINPDADKSSFRFWDTPVQTQDEIVSQGNQSLAVETTECFTALNFVLSGIIGRPFNLTGSDEMLWAANGDDTWVQYHDARGHFTAEWADKRILVPGAPTSTNGNSANSPQTGTSGCVSAMTMYKKLGLGGLVVSILVGMMI